jgi:hypothetical protein
MRFSRVTATVLATMTAGLLSTSAIAFRPMTPLPGHHGRVGPVKAPYQAPENSTSGTWQPLAHGFPGTSFPDTPLLLTDGTVIMHDGCTTDWYRLTPDNNGNYHNGTWTKTASMPAGYTPLYFASQVLADGRVMVNGGEYLSCNPTWTNKGALFDPVANSWTNVTPPTGWTQIGDAQSVVRSDGQYMVADCCNTKEAIATISGTSVTWTATGTGKADRNDEEGWTQLPDQTILTVDCSRDLGLSFNDVEIYSEATGAWTAGNPTANQVVDPGSSEVGPAPLLPNGLLFQIGATQHTDVYEPVSGTWTAGPDMPMIDGQLDSADGPAAVLPDGNILAQVSPGVFNAPSHFVEIKVTDPTHVSITQVSEPSTAPLQSSYEGRLLVLPSGQVLWGSDVGDVEIYSPKGKAAKNAIPKVKKVALSLAVGSTNNNIKGFGFNGLTYGGYYGDDAQMSTNWPLVRITNTASGHVCYARTHDHATMGISDGSPTSTKFDIPASCETGASTLQVVTNGIPSKAKAVTLH